MAGNNERGLSRCGQHGVIPEKEHQELRRERIGGRGRALLDMIASREQKQVDVCEFEYSLVYIDFRLARTT